MLFFMVISLAGVGIFVCAALKFFFRDYFDKILHNDLKVNETSQEHGDQSTNRHIKSQ